MDNFLDKLPLPENLRRRLGGGPGRRGPQRRKSRREKELEQQRYIVAGLALAGLLIIGILVGGLVNEYILKPNAVLATVNGEKIRRKDYWKYESAQLYFQARQYEQYAALVQGDQQAQFLAYAQSFDAQRKQVWGSTAVEPALVNQMVEDKLYIDGAKKMGITISDEEINDFILNQNAPPNQPLMTPTPRPTLIPQRAIWATQTAEAQQTQQAAALGTPAGTPGATPVAGTPGATPVAVAGTPGATPIAAGGAGSTATSASSPTATPVGGTPGASPVASPAATPNIASIRATAESNYKSFKDAVFGQAHMSNNDFIRLVARPQLARQKVTDLLYSKIGQTAPQVKAEHILVATQDLANQLYDQIKGGASFEAIAKQYSTDTATAANGGDLGWFTQQEMTKPFAEAAFAGQPGEVLKPVQTQYGWHIIKVTAKDPNRALTDAQIQTLQQDAVNTWLGQQRQAAKIATKYTPTPTPEPSTFAPPADAPTVPPPTQPPATPGASPVASPEATPVGGATPAPGIPGASPVASPAATPAR